MEKGSCSYFKIYILGFIIICMLGSLSFVYFYLTRDTSFKIETINETIYEDNYTILINYPVINENEVSKEIESIVNVEQESFLKEIKDSASQNNQLNINYSYTMNGNIYSLHFRSYSYIDNDYKRLDKIYYFDTDTNKRIDIENLITNKEIYTVLTKITRAYIRENYVSLNIDKDILEKIDESKDIYELLAFSQDRLLIILPLNKISSYEMELNISVDYKYIKDYLNQDVLSQLNGIVTEEFVSKTERIRDEWEFKDKKLVALTFDDGPSYKKTQTLVEELNKRDARVTFFMLGELATKQPELVRFIYDSGHTVASHTYDHKNLKKIDEKLYSYEIDYTNEILESIIGEEIKYLRPPYGSYNDKVLNRTNMSFILWSVDTLDWQLRDVDKVTEAIVAGADDGEIILLHDIHQETIEAAIKAVDILQKEGYAFVSLDELIEFKNADAQPKKVYRYFR